MSGRACACCGREIGPREKIAGPSTGAGGFRLGERVLYAGGWGERPPVPATVSGFGSKNGRRVVDCVTDEGAWHWGYLDQFTRACGCKSPCSCASGFDNGGQ